MKKVKMFVVVAQYTLDFIAKKSLQFKVPSAL
jgi:hypothetical protein